MHLISTTSKRFLLNLLLLLVSSSLGAQRSNGRLLELQASKKAKVLFHKENQTPLIIECLEPVEMQPEQWLNNLLPMGVEDRWVLVKSKQPDKLGFVRHEFKQLYRGVEVEGGEYFVFEKQGKIVRAVGKFIPVQLVASAGNKALKTCRKSAIEAFLKTIDAAKSERQTVHAEHERTLKIVANEGIYHYAIALGYRTVTLGTTTWFTLMHKMES
jgi:Zn-dependent metalloprotease